MATLLSRSAAVVLFGASLLPAGAQGQQVRSFDEWFAEHGKGRLGYGLFWYSRSRPQDNRRRRSEYRLEMEFDIPLSSQTRAVLTPELRWDSHHLHAGAFDENSRDKTRRPIFHFREAYLEWTHGPWQVSAGEQIFAWGTADGFNPTDNLNPTDYLNAPDDQKIPVLAFSATHYPLETTSLQFVLVPLFTPTRFQVRRGRWSFCSSDVDIDFERDLPSDSLSNMQFALRGKTSLEGWDLSLSYFDGYNDVGRPTLLFDRLGRPELVQFEYDKIRVIGFDFATTWGDIGLHGECAHTTTDGRRDGDYFQYVVGFDYTWADVRPGQNLRLVVEYAGEHVTSEARWPSLLPLTRLGRHFDGSPLAKLTYEFSEVAKAEVKVAANLRGRGNYYLQPSFTYDLKEDVRLKIGADLLFGPSQTFFGQFDDNDRFFLRLEYDF